MRAIGPSRRFGTAIMSVLAALGMFCAIETAVPSAAFAAYAEPTPGHCNSGPAGAVCARLYYDRVTGLLYAYGAIDPAPGHWMEIDSVALWDCSTPGGGCHVPASNANRIASYGHVSLKSPTDDLSPCVFYIQTRVMYGVDGVRRSAPVTTAYYHRSC